jgi:hypothetical protein
MIDELNSVQVQQYLQPVHYTSDIVSHKLRFMNLIITNTSVTSQMAVPWLRRLDVGLLI